MGRSAAARRNPTEGQYRNSQRQQYINGAWRDVNVVQNGQKATLNGQQVIADGQGNWRLAPAQGGYELGEVVGTYEIGEDRGATAPTPAAEVTPPTAPTPPVTPTPPASVTPPATPAAASDSEIRVTPEGVEQQGRNFGMRLPSLDEIQGYTGRTLENPFASNNLPGSEDRVTMGSNQQEANAITNGGSVEMDITGDGIGEARINQGNNSADEGRIAGRSAFLNADNAMSGLKQKEAAQGLVFASGKYWAKNPNAGTEGEPELLEVRGSGAGGENRQAVRDYKAGKVTAQDFFNNYVADVKDTAVDSDPPKNETDPVTITDDEDEDLEI